VQLNVCEGNEIAGNVELHELVVNPGLDQKEVLAMNRLPRPKDNGRISMGV
jgi:hypothetical protein